MSHFAIKSHCAALIAAKWLFSLPLFEPLHPLCSLKSGMNRSNHPSREEQRRICLLSSRNLGDGGGSSPVLRTALRPESFSAIYPEMHFPKKTRRDLLTIIGNQTPVHTNSLHQYLHSGSVGRATVSGVLMKPIQTLTFKSVQPEALSTHTRACVSGQDRREAARPLQLLPSSIPSWFWPTDKSPLIGGMLVLLASLFPPCTLCRYHINAREPGDYHVTTQPRLLRDAWKPSDETNASAQM